MPRGHRENRPADVIGNAIHVLQIATGKLRTRDMTREKSALSKKFDNHVHMVALYTVWYNYVKAPQEPEGSFAGNGGRHQQDPLEHDGPSGDDRRQLAQAEPARTI